MPSSTSKKPTAKKKVVKKKNTEEKRAKRKVAETKATKQKETKKKSATTDTNKAEKKTPEINGFKKNYIASYRDMRERMWARKRARVRLHQSFKRSYREDYVRELKVPGLLHHTADTFGAIFKNWKLFLPLIALAVLLNVFLVGIMSENTYVQLQQTLDETSIENTGGKIGNFAKAGLLLASSVTTGGLSGNLGEAQTVFAVLIFLIIWLTTIYLLRFRLANKKVKLRDALYNGLSPFISTFLVFLVAAIQAIPILLVIFTYSTALQTGFLDTPFYALIYFIFAASMITLSAYLLSSTLIAFVAVSAPGLYPLTAIKISRDLMAGRRIRFIIRLVFLLFIVALMWVVIMLPLIALDMWLKSVISGIAGWPVIPILLQIMTCFSFVFISAYLYLFYRRMLDSEDNR